MRRFTVLWAGQLVSLVGSGLTRVALGIWIYQKTGSVATFALLLVASSLPTVLLSPLAGALIDRWEKRNALAFSDAVAALGPIVLVIVILARGTTPNIIVVALTVALSAAGSAFQEPALGALVPRLVPSGQLNRVNGMVQLMQAIGQVASPAMAGVLLVHVGLTAVLAIDIATFAVSLLTLWVIGATHIGTETSGKANVFGTVVGDIVSGWSYVRSQPSLVGLLALLTTVNLFTAMGHAIFTPYVLLVADPQLLGGVLAAGGIGMVVGSIAVATWRGPKRRVDGIIAAIVIIGLAMVLTGLRPSVALIAASSFAMYFAVPIAMGYDMVIWQTLCRADMQGRAFATRNMVITAAGPAAFALASLLAGSSALTSLSGSPDTRVSVAAAAEIKTLGAWMIVLGVVVVVVGLAARLSRSIRAADGALSAAGASAPSDLVQAAVDASLPSPGSET